ncbi:Na(+) H(+) antiporter subunit F [Geomicrobium sp. JCM 19037]|uniref:Na(+)/H(+) antiporter subunit F1 n=1 Tax=unclassified Geomicrobium TaxID=2628951 RepID=UPI00045F20B0|nr:MULTISPECIES: Na(+)/H(+) antiporter subunit F1 [unclassified Geomicrobium]GAK02772.1 Na(+) H(+) antiporter subunit F [Geomicrobium sp. JCM 19037]GAK10633.1 Na(+) H(+) antiporter subunit F [Geomicrobium sp. JCM 19039]
MFDVVLLISLLLLTLSILVGLYRVIKGPSMPDRVYALDLIGINMIALIAVFSIYMRSTAYLEAVLLLGILAFIGTVAFAKYIERGVAIERNDD